MHPSIIKMKDSCFPTCFIRNKVSVEDVEKLIKKSRRKRSSLVRPSSLVKTASNFLPETITDMVNTAIDTNAFPDRAKWATVPPIDKSGSDRDIYANYRSNSSSYAFSKIIELATFDQFTKTANLFCQFFIDLSHGVRHIALTYGIAWGMPGTAWT